MSTTTTRYRGRPPKWEPSDLQVYFDIPGGGSGAIRVPARDQHAALAAFHKNWPHIAALAQDRFARGEVNNGLVTLEIAMFDSSFVGK